VLVLALSVLNRQQRLSDLLQLSLGSFLLPRQAQGFLLVVELQSLAALFELDDALLLLVDESELCLQLAFGGA